MILSRSVVYHPPQHHDLSMLGIFEMGIGVLIQPLRLMHTLLLVSILYLSLSLIRSLTSRVYLSSRSAYSVLQTLMETVPQMQMISVLSYLEVAGKTDARQYKYELMGPLSVISSVDSYPHRAPLSSLVWEPTHVSSVTKNLEDSSLVLLSAISVHVRTVSISLLISDLVISSSRRYSRLISR